MFINDAKHEKSSVFIHQQFILNAYFAKTLQLNLRISKKNPLKVK